MAAAVERAQKAAADQAVAADDEERAVSVHAARVRR
jgi:hypothetical protein